MEGPGRALRVELASVRIGGKRGDEKPEEVFHISVNTKVWSRANHGRVWPDVRQHPERWHFAEHLTGLLVAERKNVSAINPAFAQTTDPSCLNRWITQAP